jgi:ribosomal protein L7/L12
MDDPYLVGFVIVMAAVFAVFMRLASLEKRLRALSKLDAKLDALLKHAGISFDPYKEVPPAVVEALQRHKKIEAIKHYRAATGADLRQAKEFVEEVQRRSRA